MVGGFKSFIVQLSTRGLKMDWVNLGSFVVGLGFWPAVFVCGPALSGHVIHVAVEGGCTATTGDFPPQDNRFGLLGLYGVGRWIYVLSSEYNCPSLSFIVYAPCPSSRPRLNIFSLLLSIRLVIHPWPLQQVPGGLSSGSKPARSRHRYCISSKEFG